MRVTRAAARALEEDTALAQEIPLPQSPRKRRAPLGDITGNAPNEIVVEDGLGIALHGLVKATSNKSAKNNQGKKQQHARREKENTPEVLEDDCVSVSSSAVSEACEELLRPINGSELFQIPMPDQDRPMTPPSRAVMRTRRQLTSKPNPLRFDPDVHKSPEVQRSPTRKQVKLDPNRRDSFFDVIASRSPLKLAQPMVSTQEEVLKQGSCPQGTMASPLRSPLTPSSTQPSSNCEDSLAALDAMEDALDKVHRSLANVSDDCLPLPSRKQAEVSHTPLKASRGVGSPASPSRIPSPNAGSPTRSPQQIAKTPLKRLRNATPPKLAPRSTLMNPTAASARASTPRKGTKSTPVKSKTSPPSSIRTKPVAISTPHKASSTVKVPKTPSTPAFQLPGEAITARIKAQREARLARAASTPNAPISSTKPSLRTGISSVTARKSSVPGQTTTPRIRAAHAKTETPATLPVPRTRPVTRPTAVPSCASKPTAASMERAIKAQGPSLAPATVSKTDATPSPKRTLLRPSANTPAKRIASMRSLREAAVAQGSPALNKIQSSPALLSGGKNLAATTVTGAPASPRNIPSSPAYNNGDAIKRARMEAAECGRQASLKWAESMKSRPESSKLDGVVT